MIVSDTAENAFRIRSAVGVLVIFFAIFRVEAGEFRLIIAQRAPQDKLQHR